MSESSGVAPWRPGVGATLEDSLRPRLPDADSAVRVGPIAARISSCRPRSIEGRNRAPDFLQQLPRAVAVAPAVDIVPVEGVLLLHCDDSSDVFQVLRATLAGIPIQFGD